MTEGLIMHKKYNCKINKQQVGALIRPYGLIKMKKLTRIPRLFGIGEKPVKFQITFNLKIIYYIWFMQAIETLTMRCSEQISSQKTESISDDESALRSPFPANDGHKVEEGNGSTGQYILIIRYVKVQSEKYQMPGKMVIQVASSP